SGRRNPEMSHRDRQVTGHPRDADPPSPPGMGVRDMNRIPSEQDVGDVLRRAASALPVDHTPPPGVLRRASLRAVRTVTLATLAMGVLAYAAFAGIQAGFSSRSNGNHPVGPAR